MRNFSIVLNKTKFKKKNHFKILWNYGKKNFIVIFFTYNLFLAVSFSIVYVKYQYRKLCQLKEFDVFFYEGEEKPKPK